MTLFIEKGNRSINRAGVVTFDYLTQHKLPSMIYQHLRRYFIQIKYVRLEMK